MKQWPDINFVRRKRQKYIRIRVRPDKITVSAPRNCTQKEMKRFLHEKTDWIDATLSKMADKREALDQKKSMHNGEMLLRGRWKPLKNMGQHELASRWKFSENDDSVFYKTPDGSSDLPPDEVLLGYYRYLAKNEIPYRLYQFSEELPFQFKKVFIRSQKTKWGTCSSKGNLSFNWRLIKCPYWIWDYLFIHELCHTVHMNHSKEYWKLVGSYYPDFKKAKQWIKKNGALIFDAP